MNWDWLLFAGIPLVAAVIGYTTNRIAIWMLFKPHNEKRVFGRRLPFTPGLIPSRRGEMAERLGETIAIHLVNEETVASRLETPEVRRAIESSVSEHLDRWIRRELGSVQTLLPEAFADRWDDWMAQLQRRVRAEVQAVLDDPRTEVWIRDLVEAHATTWLTEPIEDVLPDTLLDELPDRLSQTVVRFTESNAFERRIQEIVDVKVDALLAADRPLEAYVPSDLKSIAYDKLDEWMPVLLEKIAVVLEDEGIKRRLKYHLYELADQMISETFREDSMWDQFKFGLMETFLVSTDDIKDRIDRAVDEAAPRLAELLHEPEVQQQAYTALKGALDRFLQRRPAELDLADETVASLKTRLKEMIVGTARSDRLREQITDVIRDQLGRYRERSVQEILPSLSTEWVTDRISDVIMTSLRNERTSAAIADFACKRVDAWSKRPIGRVADLVPNEDIRAGEQWLADQTIDLLKRETPRMVQAIDVRHLVRAQVDALPIADVEKLILSITSRQLQAITWFGGLLGFLIGLLQIGIVLIRGGF